MILSLIFRNELFRSILWRHGELLQLFHQYTPDFSITNYLDFDYHDGELDDYMANLLYRIYDQEMNNILNMENLSVKTYERLTDLVEYMHIISYLYDKQKLFLQETHYIHPQLKGYQFADGRLAGIYIDSEKHSCQLILHNIITYDDKRIIKEVPVDVTNVLLSFHNVSDVKIDGNITVSKSDLNNVHQCHLQKISDSNYCFSLLCLAGWQKLLIDIYCSEITSQTLSSDITEEYVDIYLKYKDENPYEIESP